MVNVNLDKLVVLNIFLIQYFALVRSKNKFGPAFLVSAAFIGPGTVVTCIAAGSNYAYSLLWAILFGIIAVIILQEMVIRATLYYQKNLSRIVLGQTNEKSIKYFFIALIVISICIGNSAYEGGNILGASMGLKALLNIQSLDIWVNVLVTLCVFLLLYYGKYSLVERVLTILVFLMGFVFTILIFLLPIDFIKVLKGFVPRFFNDNFTITVLSLIGTTIVPYNLFLHSSSVLEKWNNVEQLKNARSDLVIAIFFGGVISMSILISSASFGDHGNLTSILDLSASLKPALGDFSVIFLSLGFFAAGITSSITAPLAVAYTIVGLFNLEIKFDSVIFRISWIFVLLSGLFISLIDINPILVIQFAQVTNAILLPLICMILLFTMNHKSLGEYRNGFYSNLGGFFVLFVVVILGLKSFYMLCQ